mgnify:FL=1
MGQTFQPIYVGIPDGTVVVTSTRDRGKSETPLDPRFDLVRKSPTGFAWGFAGSGPHQLALALLADATGDDRVALALMSPFAHRVLASIPADEPWSMSDTIVRSLAHSIAS